MYLYIPLSGRTENVETYCISSTGILLDERVPSLDALLGTVLKLDGEQPMMPKTPQQAPEPVVELEPEPVAEPEPAVISTK